MITESKRYESCAALKGIDVINHLNICDTEGKLAMDCVVIEC